MTAQAQMLADAVRADRAWLAGDVHTAIDAADRALTAAEDPDGRAARVTAAAAARDAAIDEAAARWRRVADIAADSAGVEARGHAALGSALVGDHAAATADLAAARHEVAGAAPRGLVLLLDGVDAVLDAVRGDIGRSAVRLCGLAAITVPPDPYLVEPWDELAATAVAATGSDVKARAMLNRSGPRTARSLLLSAWLDLRTGRLSQAGAGLAAVGARPVLRRDAVLAAAVSVGLARRTHVATPADAWRRVAHVVAGADAELLHLDVWGELSVAAAVADDPAAASIAQAMHAVVVRAGNPPWAVAADRWWRVQRAAAGGDPVRIEPGPVPTGSPYLDAVRAAADVWSDVLAGEVDTDAVLRAGAGLVEVGRPWEASALYADAVGRAADHASARRLLGAGRAMRDGAAPRPEGRGGLSGREREIGTLVLDGHTQREIGARLFISPKTVEQHVANLRQKLDVASRAELVAVLRTRLRDAPVPTGQRIPRGSKEP